MERERQQNDRLASGLPRSSCLFVVLCVCVCLGCVSVCVLFAWVVVFWGRGSAEYIYKVCSTIACVLLCVRLCLCNMHDCLHVLTCRAGALRRRSQRTSRRSRLGWTGASPRPTAARPFFQNPCDCNCKLTKELGRHVAECTGRWAAEEAARAAAEPEQGGADAAVLSVLVEELIEGKNELAVQLAALEARLPEDVAYAVEAVAEGMKTELEQVRSQPAVEAADPMPLCSLPLPHDFRCLVIARLEFGTPTAVPTC